MRPYFIERSKEEIANRLWEAFTVAVISTNQVIIRIYEKAKLESIPTKVLIETQAQGVFKGFFIPLLKQTFDSYTINTIRSTMVFSVRVEYMLPKVIDVKPVMTAKTYMRADVKDVITKLENILESAELDPDFYTNAFRAAKALELNDITPKVNKPENLVKSAPANQASIINFDQINTINFTKHVK